VGKTHLAAQAPEPLIIDVDRGSGQFDVARIDKLVNKTALMEALRIAYAEQGFKTVVIDSVTAVERLLVKECLLVNKWKTLEDPGYGKGFTALTQEWTDVLSALERIRDAGKNVILIGHQKVKSVNDPTLDVYDRLELDITKNATTAIVAATDAILFYRWKTRVKKEDNGKRSVGVSTGIRELYTQEKAGFLAGNRFGLDVCIENPTNETLWEKMK
jgi:hypothetical protein